MKFFKLLSSFLLLTLLIGCGTSKKAQQSQRPQALVLSEPEQRRYDYYFLEAVKLRNMKEYDAAFELLQHCLAINPTAASAYYELSQYYIFLRMIPQAQRAMEQACLYDPENYWYAQALVNLYQHQNLNDNAIALLEDMVVKFPTRRESLFSLAELYGRNENYDKVIHTLDRIEGQLGKSEQLSMEKFRIYWQKNDSVQAFREIEGLVNEYPLDYRYKVLYGDVMLQNGNADGAMNAYTEVLTAEPDNVLALLSMASYYEQTSQDSLYQEYLDKILFNKQVAPDDKLNVMRQMVVRNEQQGADSTQIINLFQKVIQIDTEDDQIPMLYAQYLWSKGMEDESEPILNHILQIDPANKAIRMMALHLATRKNDYALVEAICEPGIEATPEALEFYFYLAIAYHQAERELEALQVTQKAIPQINSQTPKDMASNLYSIMGDIHHTQGQIEEAYAAYENALQYEPNNIGVLNNYAYYLSVERKDLDKAEEMSYRTIKAEPENSTYLDTYAWILFEKENYPMALLYIDKAMQHGGDTSSVIVEHAGDIYYMSDRKEEALKLWKQAQEMGSDSKTLSEKIRKKRFIKE